eukprot:CAMPEP_0201917344 /NCGR_PEP_ID=MMETSP0903-20130614/6751_1 /ASSEMBLY_ACC=CAM_ASM_000552 /TAXON_ID=420261 /ORGANISM="Thalassiosira antarctica, Strain CCMP982" /LENGTH=645 /DNA_ID=CAMNT_0048453385 /DNA_START=46 /DNA_END=1983 /DNA_ORIENTATION=+
MTKSKQQTPNPVCPGGPIISAQHSDQHSDHHSDLTDSTEDHENFIALLQYKDAYHMLNLSPQESSVPIPPETIQNAYDSAKEQVLTALEQCEASDKQANGRNMFFVSQQNYLELKLQALDQAYEELMPMEEMEDLQEEQDEDVQFEKGGRYAMDVPFHRSKEKEAPPLQSKQFSWNDAATNAAVRSVRTEDPNNRNQTIIPQLQRQKSSEDELDTIDVYFRPSPGHSKSAVTRRPKSPDHPSDVSSCTWDGSSIFSMVSKTKQNIEEASVGGLSDVLGPVYNSSSDRSESKPQKGTKTTTINQSKDRGNQHLHRPPSGINSKNNRRGSPKAQISPKSVTDFPASIHNDNHYDNTSNFNTGNAVVGRGKMMKGSRPAAAHPNSHDATEAARKGILRALSEDNSECLPLDDYNDRDYLNMSNETNVNSEKAMFMNKHASGERGSKPKRFFQGKSDKMPKDSNSLMASVLSEKQNHDQTIHEQSTPALNRNRVASPDSLPSSTSSRRPRSKENLTTPTPQPNNNYEDLLESEDYSYDAILQSGMEFADELCTALSGCWTGDLGFSAAASSELDNTQMREEESTNFTRSTYDDSTYHSRSTGTDGESTTFNTVSSFGRRNDSPNLIKNRRKSPSPTTTTSSDPQPQMLV